MTPYIAGQAVSFVQASPAPTTIVAQDLNWRISGAALYLVHNRACPLPHSRFSDLHMNTSWIRFLFPILLVVTVCAERRKSTGRDRAGAHERYHPDIHCGQGWCANSRPTLRGCAKPMPRLRSINQLDVLSV